MILQALVRHYEDLLARGDISGPGWDDYVKVSYALYINDAGALEQVAPLLVEAGKGSKLVPQTMTLPQKVKRTVSIASNFLWDNSSYLLGVDAKGKPEKTAKAFEACKTLHREILGEVDAPAARALLAFFDAWDPAAAQTHPALAAHLEGILSGGNMVFRYEGQYLHEIPALRAAWERHYLAAESGPEMVCLVTGKKGPVEMIHPPIMGIRGAQASGASLVSFNSPSLCSYEKEQNLNAPTSKYAAFAYTAACNHLLADKEHVQYIGDTAVLCWAEGAEPAYQGMMGVMLLGSSEKYTQEELQKKAKRLAGGLPVEFDESRLDPNRPFYVLGLAPNAGRISVRFFLRDSFGRMIENVMRHHERMEIIRPAKDPYETLPLWLMLRQTVNLNSKDKSPSPVMAGEVLRAILTDGRYPATLLNGVNLRIRAEHSITRGRAAIIKAYYLKNTHPDVPEEVLQVSLIPDSTSVPYQLGRLFSILENIQSAANPGINSTIRDKYFNAASSTPATVFPVLINLAQKHLRKIGGGLKVTLEKRIIEVTDKLGEVFPARLSLPEQGAFQLGYYHQTQANYAGKKKEEPAPAGADATDDQQMSMSLD